MPNSILLDSHKKAIAFGYEAENQYYDLVREENHHDCYFFRQFTKDIHKLQDGATTLHTINVKTFDQKKEISAHSLFGMLINFHVDDALSKLIILEVLTPEDFNWVLTIPTYWNNSVRKALIQVARKNTIVASYPEAVSLYWKFWSMKNKLDKIDLFRPEMKYIVVYGSGDTIDLACLEVEEDKSLTQLNTMVTNVEVWKKFLVGIVGKHVYSDFCSQYPNEEDYMLRDFKRKSRSFTDAQIVTLIVPVELRELYEKYSGGDFNDPSNKIVWRGDKMRIKRDLFISLFDEVIAFVVNAVREMVNDPDVMDISHIVCTGRLMQLQMIVCRLRETFHNIDIIDLPEPNISALKGAVILGHYPIVSCKRNFYRL
ncbi:heat shock 70 kDa protein 12A-like [Mytilus trossulus]|uniref:heat shock 70 kDa protein 12A-like n=1 Tax=Mytilus trossulus TaxID=6551 RepID=UPI0030052081